MRLQDIELNILKLISRSYRGSSSDIPEQACRRASKQDQFKQGNSVIDTGMFSPVSLNPTFIIHPLRSQHPKSYKLNEVIGGLQRIE